MAASTSHIIAYSKSPSPPFALPLPLPIAITITIASLTMSDAIVEDKVIAAVDVPAVPTVKTFSMDELKELTDKKNLHMLIHGKGERELLGPLG